MEFQGSKGEWVLTKYGIMSNDTCILSPLTTHIEGELEANAQLILCAREILDFINRISGEMLRNDFVLDERWYDQAQQLIKKATTI